MSTAGGVDHGLFTIVIPTYNEAGNVADLVRELERLHPGVRVTIVDDGSKDGTVETVGMMRHDHPGLSLIEREGRERGLTASVMEGLMSVSTRFFVVMDGDFQHPPRYVGDLMRAVAGGADLAIGSREGMGPLSLGRRLASGGAHRLASAYLWFRRRPRHKDLMSGFFAGRTEMAQDVIARHSQGFEGRGFKVLFDLLKFMPADAEVVECSYDFGDRASGSSKLNSDIVLSVLRQCGLGGKVASGTLHFFLINKAGRAVGFIILAAIFAIVISFSA